MNYISPRHPRLALAILGMVWAIVTQGCASSVRDTRIPERPDDVALVACAAGLVADCTWTGSYAHVRAHHCAPNVTCAGDHESVYRPSFIDSCNNARLEEVCYSTVQNPGCQYYVNGLGQSVASANLGVVVGEDRSAGCANSNVTTVVFDRYGRVVTMYPGQ